MALRRVGMGRGLAGGMMGGLGSGVSGGAFSPDDISDLGLWIRSASLALGDGDPVPSWTDSVSGLSLAQATSSLRPTYIASAYNGHPAVRFDGTDDYLDFPAGLLGLANNVAGLTVVAVANGGVTSGFLVAMANGTNGNHRLRVLFRNARHTMGGRRLDGDAFVETTDTTTATDTIPYTDTAIFDYADSAIYSWRNGTAEIVNTSFLTNGNTSATDSLSARLGSAVGAPSVWVGDLFELLIYRKALSADERTQLVSYLNGVYGL